MKCSGLCSVVCAVVSIAVLAQEACNPVAEVRAVPKFEGVHAEDGIRVNVSVSPGANASSLRVHANSDFLAKVKSTREGGTLMLRLAEGKTSSCVMAEVVVPSPLLYATAAGGARMTLDSVAGPLAASMGGGIHVGTLASSEPVSIIADMRAEVSVVDGKVGSMIISASGESSVHMGSVKAGRASVSVFNKSAVYNLTVGRALISATGRSLVDVVVTEAMVLMCSRSKVKVQGAANIMQHASSMCDVEHNGTKLSGVILP